MLECHKINPAQLTNDATHIELTWRTPSRFFVRLMRNVQIGAPTKDGTRRRQRPLLLQLLRLQLLLLLLAPLMLQMP